MQSMAHSSIEQTTNLYPTIQPSDLHHYGTIRRTHGKEGEVLVELTQPEWVEVEPHFLFLEVDTKTFIPFEVEELRGTETQWIIALKEIPSLSDAEKYVGTPIWIHTEEIPEDFVLDSDFTSIIGFTLYHSPSQAIIGTITALHQLSTNILLEVAPDATLAAFLANNITASDSTMDPIGASDEDESKADIDHTEEDEEEHTGKTHLIPFAEELLIDIDSTARTITLAFPLDLLTL